MKNILFGIIFSALISFGSTVQAVTLKEKTKIGSFKDDGDKKKKKKSDKKEDCAGKEKKSCCPGKSGSKKECTEKKETL